MGVTGSGSKMWLTDDCASCGRNYVRKTSGELWAHRVSVPVLPLDGALVDKRCPGGSRPAGDWLDVATPIEVEAWAARQGELAGLKKVWDRQTEGLG